MKTFAILSLLTLCAGVSLLNVGCSASASVRKADATHVNPDAQVAYVTAPTK